MRFFLRKRVILPILSLVLLAIAGGVALLNSNHSRIVVYNQTGIPIAALKIQACGQSIVFQNLQDEDSVQWTLAPRGSESDIVLETAADPAWRWEGGYVEPRGGYHIAIRLWPDGEVEVHDQISIWWR